MAERRWPIPELPAAAVVWVVATIAVIAAGPWIVALPILLTAGPIIVACVALGIGLTRLLHSRGHLVTDVGGLRLGAAVAAVGQILDVALVLAWGGVYPRLDAAGTADIAVLLLGGYAAFLLGAASQDRTPVTTTRLPERS